jgi:protease I
LTAAGGEEEYQEAVIDACGRCPMAKKVLMFVGHFATKSWSRSKLFSPSGIQSMPFVPARRRERRLVRRPTTSKGIRPYTEKRGHDFALNATFADVRPERYDALVSAGGRAPEYLRLNDTVLATVRHFVSEEKVSLG